MLFISFLFCFVCFCLLSFIYIFLFNIIYIYIYYFLYNQEAVLFLFLYLFIYIYSVAYVYCDREEVFFKENCLFSLFCFRYLSLIVSVLYKQPTHCILVNFVALSSSNFVWHRQTDKWIRFSLRISFVFVLSSRFNNVHPSINLSGRGGHQFNIWILPLVCFWLINTCHSTIQRKLLSLAF